LMIFMLLAHSLLEEKQHQELKLLKRTNLKALINLIHFSHSLVNQLSTLREILAIHFLPLLDKQKKTKALVDLDQVVGMLMLILHLGISILYLVNQVVKVERAQMTLVCSTATSHLQRDKD